MPGINKICLALKTYIQEMMVVHFYMTIYDQ